MHEGGEVPIGMFDVVGSTCLTWPDRIPCHRRHVVCRYSCPFLASVSGLALGCHAVSFVSGS